MVIDVPTAAFEQPGGAEFAIRQLALTPLFPSDDGKFVEGELGRLTWRVGTRHVSPNGI